jgi:GNAT superfamily N-acetyltransferase
MISVKSITPEQAYPLRHKVLWPHIRNEEDCVIQQDGEAGAFHLGTFVSDQLVSVGSFFPMHSPKITELRQYRLRAMATDPALRGQHTGRILIEEALLRLKDQGEEVLWCDARLGAVPFYEKMGFSKLPEVYDVPNIGTHQFMWKIVAV